MVTQFSDDTKDTFLFDDDDDDERRFIIRRHDDTMMTCRNELQGADTLGKMRTRPATLPRSE
jgi:hypothetical protein